MKSILFRFLIAWLKVIAVLALVAAVIGTISLLIFLGYHFFGVVGGIAGAIFAMTLGMAVGVVLTEIYK
jgi:hypothetical protein